MNPKQIKRRGYGQCHLLEPEYAASYFSNEDADDESSVTRAVQRNIENSREIETWQMRSDGTAILPIKGVLFHGSSWWSESFYQGYNTIAANAMAALEAKPARLAMIIESNGGEVDGCFACARKIRDMLDAAGIPAWAFSNESMYSAAYAIGSQADRIILPSTAGVASVGVVSTTVSYEKYLEQEGIKVSLITSGDKKVVGSPYEDLSDEDRAEIQSRVDKYADIFFETVESTRPMSKSQIESAQANIFIGSNAVDEKFADEVMDLDDFFYAFGQETGNTSIFTGENTMNKEDLQALQDKAARADALETENEKLKAAVKTHSERADEAEAERDSMAEASVKVHERYVAVMESESAVGRQAHAKEMLSDSLFDAFSAEQICAQLEKIAAEPVDDDTDDTEQMDKVLAAARGNDSDTTNITNRGASEDGKDGKGTAATVKRDARGKVVSESYESKPPSSREEHMDAMNRSAAIVKKNRSRKHI